jgi:hypothetical protein
MSRANGIKRSVIQNPKDQVLCNGNLSIPSLSLASQSRNATTHIALYNLKIAPFVGTANQPSLFALVVPQMASQYQDFLPLLNFELDPDQSTLHLTLVNTGLIEGKGSNIPFTINMGKKTVDQKDDGKNYQIVSEVLVPHLYPQMTISAVYENGNTLQITCKLVASGAQKIPSSATAQTID